METFSYKQVFYYESTTYEQAGLCLPKYLFTRFVPCDNVTVARARVFGPDAANYTNRAISSLKETPGGRIKRKVKKKAGGGGGKGGTE